MDIKEVKSFNFVELSKNGLQIPEESFNLIRDNLLKGVTLAKNWLNVQQDSWPKFNFSNDASALGYSSNDDAICISVNHLNQAFSNTAPLEYKDQLLLFIPDVFYLIVKYLYWLKLFGIESTIHRFQRSGNPKLHSQFPQSLPPAFSTRLLLFCSAEVEARTVVDTIVGEAGDNIIWKNVDKYFSANYPQYYNKSIEELSKLAKPEFKLSFEMEYYTL